MKVLITGADGFIGNHVVRECLRLGHEVITTSAEQHRVDTLDWKVKTLHIPFNIHEENILTHHDLYSFFHRPDMVIHMAWGSLDNFKSSAHTDTEFPVHRLFLQNLISNGLPSLSITGTSLEYGLQEGELEEHIPASPVTPYGQAKNDLHMYLRELQKNFSYRLLWMRLFYTFGEGQNPRSLFSLIHQAISSGEKQLNMSPGDQSRDYLPVKKMGEYIARVSLNNRSGYDIVNICSGTPVTVIEMARRFAENAGGTLELRTGVLPYPDYEPLHFWGSAKKLKSLL